MKRESLVELVTAARRGEKAAQSRIVARFRRMVHGYAYARLGDTYVAEDVAQDAFVEALRSLNGLREPRAMPGWLRRIVHNQCNRVSRRRQVSCVPMNEASEVTAAGRSPDEETEARQLSRCIERAIAALPTAQREATILFYVQDHSYAEVSAFLDIPVNTVKSRLHAAREQLKERILELVKEVVHGHGSHEEFMARIERKLGRTISPEEHERWHREHPDLSKMTPEQHAQLMKQLGINEEEDRQWHEEHGPPPGSR